jgi:hypothetical protein
MQGSPLSTKASVWQQSLPVLRYAMGATLIQAVATGSGYTLSYVTPVLALGFLAPGTPPLSLKQGAGLIIMLLVGSIIAVIFSKLFVDYPLVLLPLLGITLFHLFYSANINSLFKLWLLVSLLLIPMISIVSGKVGALVALSLVKNASLAVLLVWFIFLILPFNEFERSYAATKNVMKAASHRVRFMNAVRITMVLFPLVCAYYLFQWAGAVVTLIFVAILSMNPESANLKTGKFLILANMAGGVAAIVAYNLFVLVPQFTFLILITLLAGLFLGQRFFSRSPAAPLFGTAFTTFLLILGSVTTAEDAEAGAKVWSRILQIGMAVVYVVLAFAVVNTFFVRKIKMQDEQE